MKTLRKFVLLCTGVTTVLFGLRLIQQLQAERDLEVEALRIDETEVLNEFDDVHDTETLDAHYNITNGTVDYASCGFEDTPNEIPRFLSTDKHIVLRSVYWDPRPFTGLRRGFWVFLAVARKRIVSDNLIIGVQLDNDKFYEQLDVREITLQEYFNRVCQNLTYEFIVIRCNAPFSLQPRYAALLYKTEPNGAILSAVTENLPIVNVMPQRSNKPRKTIVSCLAPAYGKHKLLPHWIRYERTIGVSHIHIIADQSFVGSGTLNNSVVRKALESGFLSIAIWPRWFTSWQVFYREQGLAYQDCLHRFQGLYDYLFPHDADDFFVPLILGAKLNYYVTKYCRTGTCSFKWEEIKPTNSGLTGTIGRDGNVTDKVAAKHSRITREVTKSIHKLEDTIDIGIHEVVWSVVRMFPTAKIPSTAAYIAHVRY